MESISSIQNYSSLDSNTYTSSTNSSTENTVSNNLSSYSSTTKIDSKKLVDAIKSLYSETDDTKIKSAAQKFVKYYNNIIKDNSIYDDKDLKALTKKMKSLASEKSTSLSDLGITIKSSGKLNLNKSTLETAISDEDFSEFVKNNDDEDGLFYNLEKLVTKFKKSISTVDTYA